MGLGTIGEVSPVVTTGYVASREIHVRTGESVTRAVLVTPAVGSGYSGGPVFVGSEQSPAESCIGLVSGGQGDGSGAKLSRIVPSRFVAELLQQAHRQD